MRIFLLLLAIASVAAGWWLHRQRHKAAPAILIVASLAGLGFFLTGLTPGNENLEQLASDFDHCQGLVLGQHLAETHEGARALLLTSPDVGEREARMHQGLLEGLQGKVEVTETRVPVVSQAYRERVDRQVESGAMDRGLAALTLANYTLWFDASHLGRMLDEVANEVDLVISTCNLPLVPGKSGWPKLAAMNTPLLRHRAMIANGTIAAAVALKPDPRTWQAPSRMPEDARAQFNLRFLLLTPDTISTLEKEYPTLFAR